MKILAKWLAIASMCCALQMHCSEAPKKTAAQPTLMQNVAVGSLAGVTEVCFLGQPLSYAMNQMVQGKALSRNPLHWYKGCGANAAGMAPITAIQKAVNSQVQALMKSKQEAELSDAQKMGAAFVAGATSAIAATPSEAIPVYMQKPENAQMTTRQAAMDLKLRAWRGLGTTATRDGLFTVGYSALAPMMQERAKTIMGASQAAEVVGGIAAGVVTAVATQPLAVVKTELQANPNHRNSFTVAQDIYSKEGLKGLYKGITARGARVMIAIPVLTKAGEIYTAMVTQHSK